MSGLCSFFIFQSSFQEFNTSIIGIKPIYAIFAPKVPLQCKNLSHSSRHTKFHSNQNVLFFLLVREIRHFKSDFHIFIGSPGLQILDIQNQCVSIYPVIFFSDFYEFDKNESCLLREIFNPEMAESSSQTFTGLREEKPSQRLQRSRPCSLVKLLPNAQNKLDKK